MFGWIKKAKPTVASIVADIEKVRLKLVAHADRKITHGSALALHSMSLADAAAEAHAEANKALDVASNIGKLLGV